jgi:hypothetical protein
MSGVYAKDRKESPMEVITIAREIYLITYRLCMNERIIPKRHRYMVAKPIIEVASNIVDDINRANSIFPRNEVDKEIRYRYQKEGFANCDALLGKLELTSQLFPMSYKVVSKIASLVIREKQMIQAWSKAGC